MKISHSFFDGAADFLDCVHRILRRRLDAADLLTDLAGGFCSLFRQRLHFGKPHDRKAAAGFAGARRLDGGVQGEQIGLPRDGVDQFRPRRRCGLPPFDNSLTRSLVLRAWSTASPAMRAESCT